MNFLAHFYLSGNSDDVLFGNFIGDQVKGSDWKKYPQKIQEGILLHRFIDDFIDKHPHAQRSRDRLRSYFGLTSAVVLDVYYDHFLSKNWSDFHSDELNEFCDRTFDRLRPYREKMTGFYPMMVQKMEEEKWLQSYASTSGTGLVLTQMGKRVRFDNNWEESQKVLEELYEPLKDDFFLFFPEIIEAVDLSFNVEEFNTQK